MREPINYVKVAPDGLQALLGLESYVRHSGIDRGLQELVKTRVSQINGCAYCIDMHTKDARVNGEAEQRLYALQAWRETPFYSEKERAALSWAESLTRVSQGPIPDELVEEALKFFSEKELVDLTLAVVAINGWNRLAIPFRTPAGSYQPGQFG